jgi:raffinose/stachyose/melibiose transport system substrate-binding protein
MKKIKGIVVCICLVAVLGACSKKDGAKGVSISFFNSKGEIQSQLEEIAEKYEKLTGVHVEVLVAGAGESPYAKITSLYNSGTPPALAMLDTIDIIALGESKAVDLSNERWIAEVAESVTKVNGKVYSFPFCIEGRGIIFNRQIIEDTLKRPFDPTSINSYNTLAALLRDLRSAGMENPMVISKEDWSLGVQLQNRGN